ncbi:hypothetical protein HBI56_080300 [Parastagonospora nodorum]|uniref:Uncharacterized protein n=1 Tax=Phaeosphaeria nodorum (strain SN15 / ATCC MYA-4574 / FGSC 10173) TaxID=321614 RepID=A0A7U2FGI6_PHANO|nr:hypothetical protein HBH56_106430 [Parastagonospora nodorum]QRD04831.1 hypothetical protein JI435_421790 [Parastagonospora nodorum SN15]KAH3929433.1 hypothetical protein HBH54_124000 [Parastagonospora nodorum]KAH3951746.1 hypothetical protein HBH53_058000 [Parastagonospora nodorum]KAH3975500.1 hypothetical protein HBH52_128890 [Parastagonospora nodorum]
MDTLLPNRCSISFQNCQSHETCLSNIPSSQSQLDNNHDLLYSLGSQHRCVPSFIILEKRQQIYDE